MAAFARSYRTMLPLRTVRVEGALDKAEPQPRSSMNPIREIGSARPKRRRQPWRFLGLDLAERAAVIVTHFGFLPSIPLQIQPQPESRHCNALCSQAIAQQVD
jgi:hypothetical protein